jgi:hypothetical protein
MVKREHGLDRFMGESDEEKSAAQVATGLCAGGIQDRD